MKAVNRLVPTRHTTRPRVSRWWLLSTLALVLALLAGCMPIQPPAPNLPTSKAITLHLAVADAAGRPSAEYVLEFAAQVKTLSQGNVTIEPVWDGGSGTSDGFEKGVIQLVRQGKFELGLAAARTWETQGVTSFQVLQASFLITDDALAAAVATSDVATQLLDRLSAVGMVGLTLWPEDLRHPFAVQLDKPILVPTDFAGLTVRAIPSVVSYQLLKVLGARPMYEDSGYQGAESGLLQGPSLNGKPTATGNVTFFPKFQVLFANGTAFAHLSEAQRTIVRQAAAAAQKKALAEHPSEGAAAAAWCAAGGTIMLASAAQVAAFEQAAQPIFAQLEQDPSNAAIITAIRDLKAHTAPAPGATACAPTATAQPTSAPTVSAPMTPTASANMPRIVFVGHPDDENGATETNAEIYSMNADGSRETRLTNNHDWDTEPTVSRDGKRIAFVSSRAAPGSAQIYAMNIDGSNVIRLTNDAGKDDLPAFSPDGTQITFFSDRDGNVEIYVMNADGSGQTRLTNDPAIDEYPSWSPDGKKIIFDSERDGGSGNHEIRDSNGEIYVMNADGSGQTRLTHDGGHDGRPMWSPDGKKIVFETNRDGDDELYVMNADGSHQIRLTNNPNRDIFPAWSLDGQQIAFTSTRDDGNYELYVMNADGSNQTRLTHNTREGAWAAWLPATSAPMTSTTSANLPRIVFSSHRDGNTELYLMNADGTNQTRLTNNLAWDNEPTASRDGKRIAFVSDRDGNDEIYVMNVDGSDVMRLTNNPAKDGLPAFSPDGKQLVFFSNRDGNVEIYRMNADGSDQTNLTNNPAMDHYPSWSPDGKQILFNSARDGYAALNEVLDPNGEIYVMNADGSNQTRLTHDGGNDGRPLWSPDGKKILFDTDRSEPAEIYVMNADGSGQTNLTNHNLTHDGNTGSPGWSPDGKQITFTGGDDGAPEIYVMNADGSNPTRLTHNPGGENDRAAWLPVANTP